MSYTYRQTLAMTPMGHMATSVVRDAIEDAVSGAIDEGETVAVSVERDGLIAVTLTSPRSMGEHETRTLSDAVRSTAADCLSDDDEMILSGFEVVSVPKPGQGR